MPDIELSVVIPAFNEEHRLPRTLERLLSAVDLTTTEIIVVDDGSADATAPLALDLTAAHRHTRVISLPENQGKGAAVRAGIASAEGRQMLFMDADLATDLACIPEVSEALGRADLAIGSRVVPGARVDGFGAVRAIISRGFNRLIRMTSSLDLGDIQCGFKGFRGDAAKLLFHLNRIDRFAFDIEILQSAKRLGMTIVEVPVQWKAVEGNTVRPIVDSLATVRSRYEGFGPTLAHEKPDGAARSGPLGRDAPPLDDRGRSVGAPGSPRAPDPAAATPPPVSRRAHPDRRVRSRVVRGARGALHPAGVRRRRHGRLDGASVLRVGVGVLLLHGPALLPRAARQAGGAVQRQGRGVPGQPEGGPRRGRRHAVWPSPGAV